MPPAVIVFSHLRWDFVHQRPQHLLSRLARHYRVLFLEEPVANGRSAWLEKQEVGDGVTVLRPHSPVSHTGFHDEQIPVLRPMLADFAERERLNDYLAWFYTPMALPLLEELEPRLVVYDCMDELASFMHAPRQLVQRERALLKRAELVFTGGTSLYRAKSELHPNVHCFPSSVDADHFGPVPVADHPDQAAIPHPRLGFFGVIDERLDLGLLTALADARPDWQLVMVGPVTKIDESQLPRRPNIHYLGKRPYGDLPSFVHHWDVCLLPFALNNATRFISPTKTLEYMAAGRPVVSTPITDVVAHYEDTVRIAATPDAFVDACAAALAETASERHRRESLMAHHVAQSSWDTTTRRMRELIDTHLDQAAPRRAPAAASVAPPVGTARRLPNRTADYDAVIIGAGPTGLSAAYHLGRGSVVLEANNRVGGWCRSVTEGGFTFDHAGHIMFSNDPYVHRLYDRLLGSNVHWQDREAWIYSKGCYTRYPFQGALYGLPPEVLKECIIGAIEARFGSLDGKAAAPVADRAPAVNDCCADGIAESTLGSAKAPAAAPGVQPRNFEEFIYKVWGAGVAKHFAIPYNRKLWTVPLDQMETSWLGGRVPLPDLGEMIDGALRPPPKPIGPNARFGYPLRGGFQALMDGFLPLLQGSLHLGVKAVRWWPSRREIEVADGRRYRYRQLVSTMPLPELVRICAEPVPAAIREAAEGLQHVSIRCVNIGVGREAVTEKHWIYYPEDTVYHRIFVQGNASSHCNAPGGFGLTFEISYSPTKPLPCDGEALIDRCIEDAVRTGMLRADDPIWVRNQVDMPYAYVVYDHARAARVGAIREWLAPLDVTLAGRYSEWQYYNSDHAFIAGRKAAEAVQAALRQPATTLDAG
jgi:UDP-galactopyranose mutase